MGHWCHKTFWLYSHVSPGLPDMKRFIGTTPGKESSSRGCTVHKSKPHEGRRGKKEGRKVLSQGTHALQVAYKAQPLCSAKMRGTSERTSRAMAGDVGGAVWLPTGDFLMGQSKDPLNWAHEDRAITEQVHVGRHGQSLWLFCFFVFSLHSVSLR